jgi:protein-S-isoprenylcysteine O-methyltransferase Ste14
MVLLVIGMCLHFCLSWMIAMIITIIRTVLEDRILQAELPGYQDYARRVRYRLIPGIF